MSPTRSIRDAWSSYRTIVLRGECPPVQITETRRAFYAGAQAMLGILINNVSQGGGATPDALELMSKLHNELLAFGSDVKEGRA